MRGRGVRVGAARSDRSVGWLGALRATRARTSDGAGELLEEGLGVVAVVGVAAAVDTPDEVAYAGEDDGVVAVGVAIAPTDDGDVAAGAAGAGVAGAAAGSLSSSGAPGRMSDGAGGKGAGRRFRVSEPRCARPAALRPDVGDRRAPLPPPIPPGLRAPPWRAFLACGSKEALHCPVCARRRSGGGDGRRVQPGAVTRGYGACVRWRACAGVRVGSARWMCALEVRVGSARWMCGGVRASACKGANAVQRLCSGVAKGREKGQERAKERA